MIDIHSHILPAIDDGARDMAESLLMARQAVDDGITTMIATPHIIRTTNPVAIQHHIDVLQEALIAADIPLALVQGGEVPFHLDGDMSRFCLGKTRTILLELPHTHVPDTAEQKVQTLISLGLAVIIAHPERNGGIIQNPTLLADLLDCGAMAQITAGSIIGEMGTQAQHCAHHLLRQKMVHFIASDCHSSGHRQPALKKAVMMAGKIIGEKEAHKLAHDHPAELVLPQAPKGS